MQQNQIDSDIQPVWYLIAFGITVVSGFFCVVLSMFLVIGYLQVKTANPINSPALEQLIVKLNSNPSDQPLCEAVRELDLMSRNAFFTKQTQFRIGGRLLTAGIVVFFISLKIVTIYIKKTAVTPECSRDCNPFGVHRIARKYIMMAGCTLLVLAIVIALTARTEFPKSLAQMQVTTRDSNLSIVDETGSLTNKERFPTSKELQDNWPMFRGYNGNAVAVGKKNIPIDWNGKTMRGVLWKTEIPLPGFNSPIVWGNKLFLAGADVNTREIYCFDREKGIILWRKKVQAVPGSPVESPEVTDDTGYAAATMTTDGQRIYAIFGNGDLVAFSMDGEKVWGFNLGVPDNHYGHSSSLIMYKNLLIIQYDHHEYTHLLGLNAENGRTVWDIDRDTTISWSSPIIIDTGSRSEVIVESSTHVYSYAADTGKLYWELECLSGEVAPSPVYADGITYVANDMAAVVAIKSNGEAIWTVDDIDLPDVSSPLVVGDKLLLFSSFGVITCLDCRTGKIVWLHENSNGTGFYSSPILVDGLVYAVDMNGVTHIFKVDPSYQEIAAPAIGEPIVATPAFMNGRIYIRSNKWLYCIGK